MLKLRLWHSYLSLFSTPSILFFALTGALQLFSLHEAHGTYQPPPIIEKLSSLHKDQVFALKHEEPLLAVPESTEVGAPKTPPEADHEDVPKVSTYVLKWFFLLVALSLTATAVLGLWLGLKYSRNARIAWAIVMAGAVLPLAIIVI